MGTSGYDPCGPAEIRDLPEFLAWLAATPQSAVVARVLAVKAPPFQVRLHRRLVRRILGRSGGWMWLTIQCQGATVLLMDAAECERQHSLDATDAA